MPVNSVIASPKTGETVVLATDSIVKVKEHTLSHGPDGPVVKVEVSVDDGNTWQEADLLNDETHGRWCWSLCPKVVKMELGQN
jgi:sulfite oxidase